MKTLLLRLALLLCLSAFAAEAAEPTVRVSGSRDLRVAIVDAGKQTPARQAMHQAFAEALAGAVATRSGSALGFRVKASGADHAAFDLEAGVVDAVFVTSRTVPRPLAGSTVARTSAKRGSGDALETVYLVYSPGDENLAKLLVAAFPLALEAPKFLEALQATKGGAVVAQRE